MKFNNTIIINFIINGMQIYIIENYKIINKHRINFIGLVTTILQILFRKFCNHGGLTTLPPFDLQIIFQLQTGLGGLLVSLTSKAHRLGVSF